MADGIAPAIDKVGEPAPTAPEAEAHAPTVSISAPTSAPTSAPAPGAAASANASSKPDEKLSIPDGAGPAAAPPKPVEVVSVPQTPLNNQTPAGGTPRPELRIDEELKEPAKPEEAAVITGLMEPQPTPATSTPKDDDSVKDIKDLKDKVVGAVTNGANKLAEMTGALQSPDNDDDEAASTPAKRKLEEQSADADATTNGNSDKKARVEDETTPSSSEAATNGKGAKAKKDKKAAPALGRTARKTRSQGPVETA